MVDLPSAVQQHPRGFRYLLRHPTRVHLGKTGISRDSKVVQNVFRIEENDQLLLAWELPRLSDAKRASNKFDRVQAPAAAG